MGLFSAIGSIFGGGGLGSIIGGAIHAGKKIFGGLFGKGSGQVPKVDHGGDTPSFGGFDKLAGTMRGFTRRFMNEDFMRSQFSRLGTFIDQRLPARITVGDGMSVGDVFRKGLERQFIRSSGGPALQEQIANDRAIMDGSRGGSGSAISTLNMVNPLSMTTAGGQGRLISHAPGTHSNLLRLGRDMTNFSKSTGRSIPGMGDQVIAGVAKDAAMSN